MFESFTPKPMAIGAEQAVLGAIMLNNAALDEIAGLVSEEDFSEPVHARIFAVMRRKIGEGRAADVLTLEQAFQSDPTLVAAMQGAEDGGARYLARLAMMAETIATARAHALEIRETAGRRALIEMAQRVIASAADAESPSSLAELLAEVRADIDGMSRYSAAEPWRSLSSVLAEGLERLRSGTGNPIPTGLPTLDTNMGGGLYPGAVYGIEARPKNFKTGILGTIAYGMLKARVPFLFMALEMGALRIVERQIAAETSCNAMRFRTVDDKDDIAGRFRIFDQRYGDDTGRVAYFADEPGVSFAKLRSILADAVNKLGVRVVFLDYWQLITGRPRNQNQAEFMTEVAQWLAAFAARERIVVMVASQTNREGESFGSDGLFKACDWLAQVHKVDQKSLALGDHEAIWLEIRANRDGSSGDVGSAECPPFRIDKRGPVLRDRAVPT